MSNLLKDASILLTPTGYDNGRMNAIKPYKDLYGPELVTNGDFATNSDWTVGSSWTISGGSANCDGGTSNLDQASIVTNTKYKVTVTVSNITTGTLAVRLGGSNVDVLSLTENGTYTGYGLSNSDVFRLRSQSGFDGSVDNVSVVEDLSGDFNFERGSAATRVNAQGLVENVQIISSELVSNGDFSQIGTEEVLNGNFSQEGSELVTNGDFATDSDWSLQSSASISQNKLIVSNAAQNTTIATQSSVAPTQKPCKLQFDIVVNTGSFRILLGSSGTSTTVTESGTYTLYETSGNFGTLTLQARDGGFDGSIDNISVKEVGQDWSLGDGWTISNLGATCSDLNNNLTQDVGVTAGKVYKVTLDVTDYISGTLAIDIGGSSNQTATSLGSKTFYFTTTSTGLLRFYGGAFRGTISNI